jgi:NAD(P)-dependent dehydrogenase (short-subunit alcohol dehydrogenase family)
MTAKTVVVTGASDGIGAAAARALAAAGHEVVVVGRDPDRTRAVAAEIDAAHHVADFARLDDVRALARTLSDLRRIDVLANNAGAMAEHRELTVDGHERTFQVNHLAPFLLTTSLMPLLLDSVASVVTTSSVAAERYGTGLDLSDLDAEHGYDGSSAYGASKLANILMTRELHRRYHRLGLSTAAFHPGIVATSFASGAEGIWGRFYGLPLARRFMTTPEAGADTLVWLAQGTAGEDWVSGQYWYRRRIARTTRLADDRALARTLWQRSEVMVAP